MKSVYFNFVLAIALGAFPLLTGCQSNSPNQEKTSPTTSADDASPEANTPTSETASVKLVLPVAEFEALLKQKSNAQLLDVRTVQEVQEGSIPGAINYDFYQENFSTNLSLLDPQKPIFVYCKSGGRSGKTSSILQKMGFLEIYDLQGGYTAWSSSH